MNNLLDLYIKKKTNNTHILLYLNNTNNAINWLPKPNQLAYIRLKNEASGIRHLYTNSTDLLNISNAKLKKNKIRTVKLENNYNYVGKPRHYPPANKEWYNSIYAYNDKTIKLLPSQDKVTLKLANSYFNLYSRKLEKKIKSLPLRLKARRLSINRVLISRAELKHTNDKVVITIYVYNRQNKYYFNKRISLAMIDNVLPNKYKIKIIKRKSLKIKSRVIEQRKLALKTLALFSSKKKKLDPNKYEMYDTTYLKRYVTRSLRKEMLDVSLLQLISFNESKFVNRYLLPLTNLVKRVYNKKVEFNLVNLKYLYLNSYIFSEALITKIKNRKNKFLKVLNTSLSLFKLPTVDRAALYEEIYNKKKKLQNLKVDNSTTHFLSLKSDTISHFNDLLEGSLLNTDPKDSIYKLKDFKAHGTNLMYNYPLYILNLIFNSVKNISVSGIRLEVAGRLTKRNKADMSIFKLRYKGNIRNMHSSYKGLSSVLLRGYEKANLQYTKSNSKMRIGSYGLKAWVSSS